MKCKICNKNFKKLTASHIKTHDLTMDEYNIQFEPSKAKVKLLVKFINEHYITVRYRFLEYQKKYNNPFTVNYPESRSWKLCDTDIVSHLNNEKTIGIYFPEHFGRLIGLDIDTQNVEVLNRVYGAMKSYGIDDDNFLISSSGNKGYHFDIFLSETVNKSTIQKFYETLLNDIDATKKQIELRGSGKQGYKLPLGYHQKTGKHCFICDNWGNEISLDFIKKIKKLDTKLLCEIVDINYCPNSSNVLLLKHSELLGNIKTLPIHDITNGSNLKRIENLLSKGIHEIGTRHNSVRDVAAYSKDILGHCVNEAIEFICNWVNTTWDKNIVDKLLYRDIKTNVKSVYKTSFKFNVSANRISISLPEIEEVFSLKTKNKLETEALRRLYYIFLLHNKAYSDENGDFYMTYNQIRAMGGTINSSALSKRITKLAKLGKLMILRRNVINPNAGKKGQKLKLPNKYKLPLFISIKPERLEFNICQAKDKCKDCLYIALCHLAKAKQRQKYIKGKRFKALPICKHNTIKRGV